MGVIGGRYIELFLFFVLAAITLRLLSFALLPGGLPQVLRRKTGRPYQTLVAIAICYVADLVLGFQLLLHEATGLLPASSALMNTIYWLFDVRSIGASVFSGTLPDPMQLFAGISGLSFYWALYNSMKRFWDFERNDDDFLNLAHNEIQKGNYSDALRLLSKISLKKDAARPLHIQGLVGLGEFTDAVNLAKVLGGQQNGNAGETDTDEALQTLSAIIPFAPYSPQRLANFYTWVVKNGASDVIAASIVPLLLGEASREIKSACYAETVKLSRPYNLTKVILLLLLDDVTAALSISDAFRPNSPIEALFHSALSLQARLGHAMGNDQDPELVFQEWAATDVEKIQHIASELAETRERLMAIGTLTALVPLARQFDTMIGQQLEYYRDKLRHGLPSDDSASAIIDSLERGLGKMMESSSA